MAEVQRRTRAFDAVILVALAAVAVSGVSSRAAHVADATPTPLLWKDPGDIGAKDLFWGPGSPQNVPQPPFTFLEEDSSGTKPKVEVVDGRGVRWKVKFCADRTANEVHAEVAATRLVWALGYFVDENYYVGSGAILGTKDAKLTRARPVIATLGGFDTARFERLPDDAERLSQRWTFEANPFAGSRELSGLMIAMALLNNWDIQGERNNSIVRVRLPDAVEDRYLVSDLGAAFGRVGFNHTRWNLKHFVKQPLIDKVRDGAVHLHYSGKSSTAIRPVPLDHARWFLKLAAQLRQEQVRRAFEASGALPEEVEGYSKKIVDKIEELQRAIVEAVPTEPDRPGRGRKH